MLCCLTCTMHHAHAHTHAHAHERACFSPAGRCLAGSKYVLEGTAGKPEDLPPHVKRSLETGLYHGGRIEDDDFDYGHHGMKLDDFMKHKHAKVRRLCARQAAPPIMRARQRRLRSWQA